MFTEVSMYFVITAEADFSVSSVSFTTTQVQRGVYYLPLFVSLTITINVLQQLLMQAWQASQHTVLSLVMLDNVLPLVTAKP